MRVIKYLIAMIDLIEKINLLKQIPRMGWLEGGIDPEQAEDVAQHTFITATITLVLSDSVEGGLDSGRALKMAVIHDWAEAITGDFSKRVTSLLGGEEVKENIEEKALEDLLLEDLSTREIYLELWREYSENETREAKLVHVADRFSMLVEANRLFRKGEKSEKLMGIWNTVRCELEQYVETFPVVEELLETLDENRPFSE